MPYTEALTQMEVAQVQVEGDQENTRLSQKRLASQLSDDEGISCVSQLTNLSKDEISDSVYSGSFKKNSDIYYIYRFIGIGMILKITIYELR